MGQDRSGATAPLPTLPARRADSHKGDYGRAVLIGGSRGMSGAIALAGGAALRGGAGLVNIATAEVCLETVASFEPSYMTTPLPADEAGRINLLARDKLGELLPGSTCVACGPGMGRSPELTELVGWLFESIALPMVFDADALNALSERKTGLQGAGGPRVLTPHPGEFKRLAAAKQQKSDDLASLAVTMAAENGVVIVLKGNRTLVTDGQQRIENTTGNPGMATGGCGDILTGLITALICQGLSPFDAARLGVHVHGLAGDLAAAEFGQISMIARDLIDFLPRAFQQL